MLHLKILNSFFTQGIFFRKIGIMFVGRFSSIDADVISRTQTYILEDPLFCTLQPAKRVNPTKSRCQSFYEYIFFLLLTLLYDLSFFNIVMLFNTVLAVTFENLSMFYG